MKKFFLSLAAMMVATVSYSQNTLVATLSHGDNVTMYYGTSALRNAHAAAVSGDIINLSGGGFQSVDITKAITLRGVGINDSYPTVIMNNFNINISTDDENRFSMEGIRCNAQVYFKGEFDNPYFLKCCFNSTISFDNSTMIKKAIFANCKITGYSISSDGKNSIQFINCYLPHLKTVTSSALFMNCIVYMRNNPWQMQNTHLINCIIFDTDGWTNSLLSSTVATNCITIGNSNLFNNTQTNPNCQSATFADVFKDFTGTYSDTQTFELTEEAKTKYLGTDGTEVGMYGGALPYTSTPSYPQITKMNVANKTTADGKLSVEIEVSAAE